MLKKDFLKIIFKTILFSTIYLLICNHISYFNIVSGLIISLILSFITEKTKLQDTNKTKILGLILFPFYLIFKIYSSAFHTIKLMFTKKLNVESIEIDMNNYSSLSKVLVQNGITLTPGTAIIDSEENKSLAIALTTKDKLDNKDVISNFETLLVVKK